MDKSAFLMYTMSRRLRKKLQHIETFRHFATTVLEKIMSNKVRVWVLMESMITDDSLDMFDYRSVVLKATVNEVEIDTWDLSEGQFTEFRDVEF